ncbi:hypothetical protein RIF29_32675 [Crotalaria pallida]|uniref:Zinc finger PHD-type domain-containing protein n=1 Tax=Crotalaria pallida TaxID=3830 RepID=A0AAN9HXU3_CROPI
MHRNRALMGSKGEEFSDENCRLGEEANQYSMDDGDGSSLRSRACEKLKCAVSETSNMPSVDSSHDSLSENAESRHAFSRKYQESKCLDGQDDNASCISRASNANLMNGGHQTNADRINISCSSASISHLGAEGSGSGPSVDLSETLSSKDVPEKLLECCMENVDSSLTKERAPIIVSGEKTLTDKDSPANFKDEDHRYSVHDGLHEKAEELNKSHSVPVPEPELEDEIDVSNVEDVDICDICGDAGIREQLAFCSKCSDGAEHIYCMRQKLEKVPEGIWLCEECEYAEDTENQRLDEEENKHYKDSSTSKVSGKRPSVSVEVAIAAKKQALESNIVSPKASSPKKKFPLSRESSFKIIDKVKVKSGPIRNKPGGDVKELTRSLSAGPRSQSTKSTLLKSNSFNINSKPRVKLVDELVPQKQKGSVEHASKNMETPARMVKKSMSFISSNLGRSNSTEAKVKMLSPKSVTGQDLKGSRLAKESGAFDRKFPSRIDRPVVCSTMTSSVVSTTKGEQKVTPRGEVAKLSAVNNNQEFKVNQDGKLSSSSKSMSNVSRKSLEALVSSEITSTSVDKTQKVGIPRSEETANQLDKTKDNSSDCVRSGVTYPSKKPFCHICKDFGHPTECCTIGSTREFSAEVSATVASSSKEEMHKGSRMKALIQEALHGRPEIYKKKEIPDQTDEFLTSGSDMNYEVTSQDQMLVSNTLKNSKSAEETNVKQEILEYSTFETSKCLSANDLRQLNLCPTDFCSQLRKANSVGPASETHVVRALPNQAFAVSDVLSKMSVLPEYEYIWQGVFEVHRSGKPPDLYTGIQAHLSTCASPKVLEAVNKFLPKVSVNEVSRLSAWPSQFHQGGAKEDNIALYFFAKDIESYEREYKSLLDHMIRNDLALKGISDGVELLIFPSHWLPENSQRWNMLFFLWGVFRGRKLNSDYAEKICIPSLNVMPMEKDFPAAVMTLSETRCLLTRMDEESIACDKACTLPSSSIEQGHIMVNRSFDIKETTLNLARQDSGMNTKSTLRIPTSSMQLYQEMNSTGSPSKDSAPEDGQYRYTEPPETMGTSVNTRIVETKTDYDTSVKQENSFFPRIPSVGNQQKVTASNIGKNKISDRMNNDEDQGRLKRKQREDDLNIDTEATFQEDLTVKAINSQLPNDNKIRHMDLSDTVMQASAVSSHKIPWNEVNDKSEDGGSSSKKLKTDGIYGCCSSGGRDSFNERYASLANDIVSCSSVVDKECKEVCDEKIIHEDFGTKERTFFPVKGSHEYEDQFQAGIPNLELALGGETKQPHKGILPFFVGALDKKDKQEKPQDLVADDEPTDDNVAASLSLSLAFPSSNQEHINPVSKTEHLPDGHHVNTSLLLFGRFTDK